VLPVVFGPFPPKAPVVTPESRKRNSSEPPDAFTKLLSKEIQIVPESRVVASARSLLAEIGLPPESTNAPLETRMVPWPLTCCQAPAHPVPPFRPWTADPFA
jgi:hypothetical protein